MTYIRVNGDIEPQEIEVRVDLSEIVSEHHEEVKEELEAQGYLSDRDNEEIVSRLCESILQVQQQIRGARTTTALIKDELNEATVALESIRSDLSDLE